MSDNKNIDNPPEAVQRNIKNDGNIALPSSTVTSVVGSVKNTKTSQQISSERQIKFERAQKCLENAALVSKRIKEQRKATAELLGRPFEDDDVDAASEMASTMSEKTGYSVATDVSSTLSVQDALNIPGISESLANTLKQKELLLERIKHYKEISKKPAKSSLTKREVKIDSEKNIKKDVDNANVPKLMSTIKEKENTISVMAVKMKAMETTVLELQEKINEKDQIIEAKNMATTLMSDTLSKKEKDSFVLLEDTKQQMIKMQENFIAMESEWKQEKNNLLKIIEDKKGKIHSLEEANTILEASRFEISVEHAKTVEEIDLKNKEILRLEETIQNLTQVNIETAKEKKDIEEEKGSLEIAGMAELTKKVELLEHINCQIRQTNKELENKLASINADAKTSSSSSPNNKGSPLPARKGGRNTASRMKSPWSKLSSETLSQDTDKKVNKNEIARLEMLIQSLNKDILDKEYIISQKEELISKLQSADNQKQHKNIEMIDIGTCTHDTVESATKAEDAHVGSENLIAELESKKEHETVDVKELQEKLRTAQEQIVFLNSEIDAANKNMIKVKSNHKLKIKQMQKTIDNFSKVSDTNSEIVRLNEELHQLSQKVAELEEEKGNLQLHLVDYDSGRLTESDIYKKMVEMENLAETRLQAISLLETQKFDLVQELHVLQQKNNEMEDKLVDISQLQTEHVSSEIKSVQLEEQIDKLIASNKKLEQITENLKFDKEELNRNIKFLEEEKEELLQKLEQYIQENMDLTDKLEKLSAEKVSSAESIEIVESLTTQEKLELEEYNKNISENKASRCDDNVASPTEEKIENLMEESSDLNDKIQLFTQEREEVIDKMSKINEENEILRQKIADLNSECEALQNNIELLNIEKTDLLNLNQVLNQQLEETKQERVEIIKETAEIVKSTNIEDTLDTTLHESQHEEKITGDKGVNRTKSVKQLTKEILKLKNTIKEREEEIADCQMKILSLEEQQQKQNDILQINATLDNKIRSLTEENGHLKEELDSLKLIKESEQQLLQYKHAHAMLQQEIQKVHQEYSITVATRESRINELENVLLEYEKQLFNYGNTLQQKDKEISEYINQITQLNDVSKKLKVTVEMLEEEKTKDQNGELIKSLKNQTANLQKKLMEYEDKMRTLEEEKSKLILLQTALENKNLNIDTELRKLQEAYTEKQALIKDLQAQHIKYTEEKSALVLQTKERDEEIHEIKLQLRKESIENEKLRINLTEKENNLHELTNVYDEIKQKLEEESQAKDNLNQENIALKAKNKDIIEKLKKFAFNLKKKTLMYTELETTLLETQKQLEGKNELIEQLSIQIEALPAIQDKLKHAEEEINRLQSLKLSVDISKSEEINNLQAQNVSLENNIKKSSDDMIALNDRFYTLQKEFNYSQEENVNLKSQIDSLNKKIAVIEIEQKNNMNFETKISSLDSELKQKENQIVELYGKLDYQEQLKTQTQFGFDAKIQERDLYIEGLEADIYKYKSRICRLEESISAMEDRRYSLERKADQLGSELQEKQKAYSDYTNQEDELVGRLAVLMDHDRVVEKQLYEIENENKDLHNKVQFLTEQNQDLEKSVSELRDQYNAIVDKASRFDIVESDLMKCQSELCDAETLLKRNMSDNQALLNQKKKEIEDLEIEFNTQIESSLKEKKVLSEKYEKTIERVSQLELKLREYSNNIETLNKNLVEINNMNQDLIERSASEHITSPDYTEQYISEINKLNSIINSKNQEINECTNKIQSIQMNNVALISDLESKIFELSSKLNEWTAEKIDMQKNNEYLEQNNEHLQLLLKQKEEIIKELVETKKLSFEMNIPKTEGMVISSTIESLNEDQKPFDLLSLESQIIPSVSLGPEFEKDNRKQLSEEVQRKSVENVESNINTEAIIVPKKAYLCYDKDDDRRNQDTDPFNSDEGWGLGDNDSVEDVTPGFTHLSEQIQQLKKDNEVLKSELHSSNSKLIKALKKLKELKNCNEMLSNELKISKQLTQSSFLDNAIEDELRINIQDLEKKIQELRSDINKERREKEQIKKQNEVFNNANDRLTEIKEKLDNEIELWKFKFKEANDKLSTMQWSADSKESPQHKSNPTKNINEDKLQEEIIKLEKENDELNSVIDRLTIQNRELTLQHKEYEIEINSLNDQINNQVSSFKNNEYLQSQLKDLQHNNAELLKNIDDMNEKIMNLQLSLNETTTKKETLSAEHEKYIKDIAIEREEIQQKCLIYEKEIEHFKLKQTEANNQIIQLNSELEKSMLLISQYENQLKPEENYATDKYTELEQHCKDLKQDLENANTKVMELELKNSELVTELKNNIDQINELNTKIQELHSENDNLLSTVAELRSSVSSAIDQRGFEIAELWKQHLAQRESDFQKIENDLRLQLNASESKYEQLLDNVQSSTQEETNKLIMTEQVSSLQNKLQDKEEHLSNLQEKYAEIMHQLDILRSEMEDEKVSHENKLLEQQEEYEKVIQELRKKNFDDLDGYESNLKNALSELTLCKENNEELIKNNKELLSKMEEMNSMILDLNNELRLKDNEIYQKTHDYNVSLSQRNEEFENLRKHLNEFEKKVEDLTFEKESELAVIRLKMHENKTHYEKIQNESNEDKANLALILDAKIVECTNLNKQISDLNKTLEEHSTKTAEMQLALENQEIEIVSLKDEILSLENMLKVSNSKIQKHVSFAADTKPSDDDDKSENMLAKNLLDAVPRAELDLAFYMLHQRDVRCEELTMELTQLLEERDTLQLRLSDSLRSHEDLKSKFKAAGLDDSMNSSRETISELPTFSVDREQHFVDIHRGQTSRSSSISDGDKPKLQAKLSELRSVKHSRDVRLRHESEQRQMDLRLLQRDVENLPPEAVDQLTQAHHTLSRDAQSTPTVLLNWLRGKSTPKVVHM